MTLTETRGSAPFTCLPHLSCSPLCKSPKPTFAALGTHQRTRKFRKGTRIRNPRVGTAPPASPPVARHPVWLPTGPLRFRTLGSGASFVHCLDSSRRGMATSPPPPATLAWWHHVSSVPESACGSSGGGAGVGSIRPPPLGIDPRVPGRSQELPSVSPSRRGGNFGRSKLEGRVRRRESISFPQQPSHVCGRLSGATVSPRAGGRPARERRGPRDAPDEPHTGEIRLNV